MKSPAVLFVYNRPVHTARTLHALAACSGATETELFIFCDAAKSKKDEKNVRAAQNAARGARGFKRVNLTIQDKNYGLADSIINGISEVITRTGQIIVLEDDMLCAQGFLLWMNAALDHYRNNPHVLSVSSWRPECSIPDDYQFSSILFPVRSSSWGWGTWDHVWKTVDWGMKDFGSFLKSKERIQQFSNAGPDMLYMLMRQYRGDINSWSIRFDYHHARLNGYCAYSAENFITNIGLDGSGVHCKKTKISKKMKIVYDQSAENPSAPHEKPFQDTPDRVSEHLLRHAFYKKAGFFMKRMTRQAAGFYLRKTTRPKSIVSHS